MTAEALEVLTNLAQTTITSGGTTASSGDNALVAQSSTLFPLADVDGAPPTQFRIVDQANPTEVMIVTDMGGTGNNSWTVIRGAEGTAITIHAANWVAQIVMTVGGMPLMARQASATKQTALVADANYTVGAIDQVVAFSSLSAARLAILPPASQYSAGYELTVCDYSGNCSLLNQITVGFQRTDAASWNGTSTITDSSTTAADVGRQVAGIPGIANSAVILSVIPGVSFTCGFPVTGNPTLASVLTPASANTTGSGNITITPTTWGTDNIGLYPNKVLYSPNASLTIRTDGNNWFEVPPPQAASRERFAGIEIGPGQFQGVTDLFAEAYNNPAALLRNVLCFGDSTAEGTVAYSRIDGTGGTGTVSFGSGVLTINDNQCVSSDVGRICTGTGFNAGTEILTVIPGTSFTISRPTSASGTSVTIGQNYWINLLRQMWPALPGGANGGLGFRGIWSSDFTFAGTWAAVSRTDTASYTSATNVIADATVRAVDLGKPCSGTNIPANSYVGTVTAGASFLLSSSPTSQVNVSPTGSGTSVAIGSGGNTDLGAYHLGECCDGSASNIVAWTRPSGLDAEWFPSGVAFSVGVILAQGANVNATSGVNVSVQFNGTGSWTNVIALAVTGTPGLVFATIDVPSGATSFAIRAADASGTPAAIPGVYGAYFWATFPGAFEAGATIINDMARSGNFLVSLNGFALPDFVGNLPTDQITVIVVGPYTNDALLDTAADYQTNIANLLAHYPMATAIVLGPYEEQGFDVLQATLVNGSPNATVTNPGLPWLATRDNGRGVTGASLTAGTTISSVTDGTHIVLSNNWTGTSGTFPLTFAGRSVQVQNQFRAAAKAAALANGAMFLDLRQCWGSFATAWAAGMMNDQLHEAQPGHTDIAHRIFRAVRGLT